MTDAQRKEAEDALAKAQRLEREQWGERARAAQQAVRDLDQVVAALRRARRLLDLGAAAGTWAQMREGLEPTEARKLLATARRLGL